MRISEKLAELLNASLKPDRPIDASDFWLQKGDYRKARWDLARWGLTARIGGADRSVCSFDTMTACVRNGIDVTVDDGLGYADYEIHRKGRLT